MSKPTILCVDDERMVLSSLRQQLRRQFQGEYDVEMAESGEEGLEIIEELLEDDIEIPVIISDQIMPGMTGDQFLIATHMRVPKTLKILLTGQADVAAVGNAVNEAKLYRYITKPWEQTDLNLTVTEAVRSYFQNKKLAEQNAALQKVNEELGKLNATLEEQVARRTAQLEEQRQMAESLREVAAALSATLDRSAVLPQILEQLHRVIAFDSAAILLHEGDALLISSGVGQTNPEAIIGQRLPLSSNGPGIRVFKSKQPLIINDVQTDPNWFHLPFTDHIRGWMGVPLTVGEQVIGVLCVNSLNSDTYNEADAQVVQTFAAQAAIAIENAQLYASAQREKEYFESLVKNSPVAIVTTDLEAKIVSWNPAAHELFGYAQSEAIDRNLDDLVAIPETLHDEAVDISQQTLGHGDLARTITQRNRKDGTLVDVELSSVPVFVAGGEAGSIVIYHDITELQRARQEAEAANEAKSAFLATMSHEIRTPMNGVIGMTSLLLDTSLTPEQRDFTETIRQSGDALLTIINDILDFSKIEAGKFELESQPFDLRDCLEGALDLLATKTSEKGIDLAYQIASDTPEIIIGDVTRLRQILINLLNNAIKFTEKGEVVVSVKSRLIENSGKGEVLPETYRPNASAPPETSAPVHEISFAVKDTGLGIPPERMGRLFQAFSQVDASTARRFGGTGLGLVISKRLSELMGGTMWVESEGIPGKGSTFSFSITAEAVPNLTYRYLHEVQPQLSGRRVLIVDDNATNRLILRRQAESWGMTPKDTGSPLEALAWLRQNEPFDVAVLDMRMPEMDGVALAKEIRLLEANRPKETQRSRYGSSPAYLPLVMLTSLGHQEFVQEADAAIVEFAAFLTKPIKPSFLFDALVSIFAGQPTHIRQRDVAEESIFDATMGERHPLHILLAEDNATNQKLALHMLKRLGYRADVAANGLEVLEALDRQVYDVILMDMQMPEMDGLEATRRIRRQLSNERQPRIIAMTANAMQGDRELCLEAGMNDYVSKPIRVEALTEALGKSQLVTLTSQKAIDIEPISDKTPVNGEMEIQTDSVSSLNLETDVEKIASQAIVDGSQPLDPTALDSLRDLVGGDPELMVELLDSYLEEAPLLVIRLRQAIDQSNADELRIAAHTLKSSSADFGAMTLAELCKTLEALGKAGDVESAADLVTQAELEYEQVDAALTAIRAEQAALSQA